MRVLLVTTWATDCGIAEHSAMLKEAVEAADPTITVAPDHAALDPQAYVFRPQYLDEFDLVHLNYHAALHSRWTPDQIQRLRLPVVVTYHDTGVPNSDQCKAVIAAADAAVVHEPFDDLPAAKTRYWRMGVEDWHQPLKLDVDERPYLGTLGFAFPWKNYDELCKVTAAVGWGLLLIAPRATVEQVQRWQALQPHVIVRPDFVDRHEAISLLAGCDATAFTYVTHNTGQSGAVLLGVATRKPVLALSTCRQFRALYHDPLGARTIRWVRNFEQLARALRALPIQRVDPGIVALAAQESWTRLGAKYAALYRELL